LSDKEIITGCLRNDRNSQKALFDKYSRSMKTLCLRYVGDNEDAEDVLQNGFILMFENLGNFKFEGSFEGWLRKIMTNACLKHLIDKKKMKIENIDESNGVKSINFDIDLQLSGEVLLKGLMSLPAGYRTVFNMYVIEGYSHREIAELLNIEESSSRSQLAKAKIFLRKLFNDTDFI